MSQMGMSTDSGLASEAGRRKFPARGDQQQSGNEQTGTTNDQVGAEADDEVPGMLRKVFFLKYFIEIFFLFKDLVENFDEVSNSK